MLEFSRPPSIYPNSFDLVVSGPVGTTVVYSTVGDPVVVNTVAASAKYPPDKQPYVQTVEDGRGRLILDGSFPKFYNNQWIGGATYNALNDREKAIANSFLFLLEGRNKVLVLGDAPISGSYPVKGTGSNGFYTTLTSIASTLGLEMTIKDVADYANDLLNPSFSELMMYDMIFVMSSVIQSSPSITNAASIAIAEARRNNIGVYICTDHGSDSPTSGFYATANAILKNIVPDAAFLGRWDFSPGETVGFNKMHFGDSPLFDNLDDSALMPASNSDSSVIQPPSIIHDLPLTIPIGQGWTTIKFAVIAPNGDITFQSVGYGVNVDPIVQLLPDPIDSFEQDYHGSQYVNLTIENDDGTPPGTPIWEPNGTWYPTTHVVLESIGELPIELSDLTRFFYEIANFNLVLYAIDQNFDAKVVADHNDPNTTIVATAIILDQSAVAHFNKP